MGFITGALAALGSIISILDQTQYTAYATRLRKKLSDIQSDVQNRNKVNNDTLSKLNGMLNQVMALRQQIDPRLIGKVDDLVNKYNGQIAVVQQAIEDNANAYNKAVSAAPEVSGSLISNLLHGTGEQIDQIGQNNKYKEISITDAQKTIQQS